MYLCQWMYAFQFSLIKLIISTEAYNALKPIAFKLNFKGIIPFTHHS